LSHFFSELTMIRIPVIVIVLLSSWQSIAAPQLKAEDAAAEVKAVLLRMRQHLSSVNSVSYSFERSMVRTLPEKAARTNNTIGEFGYSKGKFWDYFDSNYEPGKVAFVREAFDGKFYQRLEPAREELVVWVKPSSHVFNGQPLLHPFGFVIPGGQYNFELFTNEATWLEFAKKAKLVEPQTINGHECEVIAFERPAIPKKTMAASFQIFAAKDLGLYPIRLINKTPPVIGQGDVVEFKKVDVPGGFIVIPTKFKSSATDENGKVISTTEFTLKLTSLNEPLADSKFYIIGPEKIRPVDLPADIPDDFVARRSAALAKGGATEKP
jgi:hypothetical protein